VKLVSFVTLAILQNYKKSRKSFLLFAKHENHFATSFAKFSRNEKFRQKPYPQLAISFPMGLGRTPFPLCRYNTSAEQAHGSHHWSSQGRQRLRSMRPLEKKSVKKTIDAISKASKMTANMSETVRTPALIAFVTAAIEKSL
jgi:hypothetical protein